MIKPPVLRPRIDAMAEQAKIGILMLDTAFPRFLGDVGNPESFDFPVRYGVVAGATPDAIVCADQTRFEAAFIEMGQRLVAQGCAALATTCGFLTLVRERVETGCGVPVVASALEQVEKIASDLPAGQVPGILTISAQNLSPAHLAAANVPDAALVCGMEGTHFAASILANSEHLDADISRGEMVAVARAFCNAHPEIGALVLECTNMPPYADEIVTATGRPVYSILTALNALNASL